MEGRRFDVLTRRWAGSYHRRQIVRSVAGVAGVSLLMKVGGVSAAAPNGSVPLGGACGSVDQCRTDGMGEIVCTENGIAADGELNCCRDGGGCCGSDADCCGDLRCAPTGDVCSVCARPPFATRFLGEACDTDADCVASVVYDVACVAGVCRAPGVATPERDPLWRLDPEATLAAAVDLSRLEATGAFDALYDEMHADARAVVPRAAVVGWYSHDFAPRRPGVADAIKVRFVTWTWPVSGVMYPNTAEVTYQQSFADGSVVRDAVRLVRDDAGAWRWFFGRDRAFVDEQIARYGS
jgi:hypothetical protein